MAAALEKNNANKAEHEGGDAKKTYSPYDLNASDNPGNISPIAQRKLRRMGKSGENGASLMEHISNQRMRHPTLKIGGPCSP